MKIRFLHFLLVLLTYALSNAAFSQYNETIRTGRPGEAIGPFAVGARVFQVQAGLGYFDFTKEANENTTSMINGNAFLAGSVFRFGLTERFEINSGIGYENGKSQSSADTTFNSGIKAFALGFRSNIYVGQGWVPSVGFQVNIGMPWLSKAYNSTYVRPRLTLITNQRMADRWALTTNWGLFWNGNSAAPLGFYVINVSFDASAKWSVFIEPFGFIKENTLEAHIDGGFAYLLTNDLQFDIAAGFGGGESNYSDWFINAGVSWRIRFKQKQWKDVE